MNKYIISALTVLAINVACASTAPVIESPKYTSNSPAKPVSDITPVWIDETFSPSFKQTIRAAFKEWNTALNGYGYFEVISEDFDLDIDVIKQVLATDQGVIVLNRSLTDKIVMDMPEGVLAWVSELEAHDLNIVTKRIGTRNLKTIVMHEIGHTLGVGHLPVKGSLMFPIYESESNCIDKLTIMMLSSIHSKYDYKQMSYCEPL